MIGQALLLYNISAVLGVDWEPPQNMRRGLARASSEAITHAMAGDTKPRMLPLSEVQIRNEAREHVLGWTSIQLYLFIPVGILGFRLSKVHEAS